MKEGLASRVDVIQLDVSSEESVQSAKAYVADKYGSASSLYGIVNNAGVGPGDAKTILDGELLRARLSQVFCFS